MNSQKKAFTLIELIVAITIFFVMLGVTYTPYTYYMNKAKVRSAAKEISSSLYEARNMVLHGVAWDWNISVWIAFDTSVENKDKIRFYSYPHSYTGSQIVPAISGDIQLIKTYVLQPGMQIDAINSQNNALFFFESISWNGTYSYTDDFNAKQLITDDELDIVFSFWWADSGSNLAGKIKYFTKTNIVDYE